MTTPKPVPSRELSTIAPPNVEHEYFKGYAKHPFLSDAEEFALVNAWWMAEAALLAYADPSFVEEKLLEAGLSEFRNFDGKSTQCYVAHGDPEFAIVSFSGSDMRQREGSGAFDVLADWLVNLNFDRASSVQGGQVHGGFKKALDEIWDPPDCEGNDSLKKYLENIRENGREKVWFTGHSLGGALAVIAAARYEEAAGVYTFGAPRVGDREFVKRFDAPAYRFVNGEDVVTGFPLRGRYRHVGENRIIGSDGQIRVARAGWSGLRESAERAYLKLKYRGSTQKPVRDVLLDHAPIFYAVHIWNVYVEKDS